jgi:hypothetical protein
MLRTGRWSVAYVVDDMIPIAAQCWDIPPDYRARLARFAALEMQALLALNPLVLAPNRNILSLFPQHEGRLIAPCLLERKPPAPVGFWRADPLQIAFLGTRSHVASLSLLRKAADGLARAGVDFRLTLFLGRHAPRGLRNSRHVENLPPLGWERFRAFLRERPIHLGLAPLADAPFARGRSVSKILDHAAAGCAGVYSRRPPFADVVSHGGDGLLAGDDPREWVEAALGLARDREGMRRLAAAGQNLAARIGDPAATRAFWLDYFNLAA